MMKLFKACNTSSCWWVIAPDEEIAIKYSFHNTSTREERNLYINSSYTFSIEMYKESISRRRDVQKMLAPESGLHELLEDNQVGIAICIEISNPPGYRWNLTVSDKWYPEKRIWGFH
ncbi:hypothetical protein RIVM261_078410 [Rivularia sp. IAM M-261]|nr:hypothetical protein RIVM261_078410 [Rivularia sp. IAM M-261]